MVTECVWCGSGHVRPEGEHPEWCPTINPDSPIARPPLVGVSAEQRRRKLARQDEVVELHRGGASVAEIVRALNVSSTTVYNDLRAHA